MDAHALSSNMENYLETILLLIRKHSVARAKDIAESMKVNRSSVTGALQALSERGLVNYAPYDFITLTPSGTEVASKVLWRHEALRNFFVNVLAIDGKEADEAACRMEHGVSKTIVDRLLDFAAFVENCPKAGAKWVRGFGYQCKEAGHNRNTCESCILQSMKEVKSMKKETQPENATTFLSELKPGETGHIEKVAGSGSIKRRITDMGFTKGSLIEVIRVAPMGDPIDVKIKGYHLSLRKEEAANITVLQKHITR
jgi:DtxR family transcriptional regulator, Mn-dependent transcriptional regulator